MALVVGVVALAIAGLVWLRHERELDVFWDALSRVVEKVNDHSENLNSINIMHHAESGEPVGVITTKKGGDRH